MNKDNLKFESEVTLHDGDVTEVGSQSSRFMTPPAYTMTCISECFITCPEEDFLSDMDKVITVGDSL